MEPNLLITPLSGCIIPEIIFNKVDLPEPFVPTIPRDSPELIENVISSKINFDVLSLIFFLFNAVPLKAKSVKEVIGF